MRRALTWIALGAVGLVVALVNAAQDRPSLAIAAAATMFCVVVAVGAARDLVREARVAVERREELLNRDDRYHHDMATALGSVLDSIGAPPLTSLGPGIAAHLAAVRLIGEKLRAGCARVAELEAMEQRARGVVDAGEPADAAVALYVLGEAS